ncbi:hypothetical protein ACLB2K_058172 [Fragaria x ananassa]
MENVQDILPPKTPIQSETMSFSDCITPSPLQQKDGNSQSSGNDIHKTTTPDRLKVPKAFKFPERYTSPTDKIMSPVTKGLLGRNRKGSSLLPPSKNLLKPTQGNSHTHRFRFCCCRTWNSFRIEVLSEELKTVRHFWDMANSFFSFFASGYNENVWYVILSVFCCSCTLEFG